MSDKTKFYAEQARIARSMEVTRAKMAVAAKHAPRCQCGHGFTANRTILASNDNRDRVIFYCVDCAPPEALAVLRRSIETN